MKILSLLFLCLIPGLTWAESVELSSGEVVEGTLLGFPKEVTIQLLDGTKKTVPYDTVNSIFKNQQPHSFSPLLPAKPLGDKTGNATETPQAFDDSDDNKGPYSSPTQTFLTWKNAAMNGDTDGMVNCYVTYRKNDVKKDLKKISKKTREDMRKAISETIFAPSEPYFQGEDAIMEVSWTKGLASQTQTLKFNLENKDWKIVE